MTNLERWLKRFVTGAGAAYDWELRWQMTAKGPRECLRAVLPAHTQLPWPAEPCPLVMQEFLDGFPSMLGKDMLLLLAVADGDPDADRELRRQVYAMCQVKTTDMEGEGR